MSTLESSITLDDVFVVVGAKRVPLAPELAGYLALEIAEGAGASGEVDPKSVYIGEEGSVALVRKRDPRDPPGDAEGSIRAILARLLDASGSQTTALGAVARRREGNAGIGSLIEELEAALIPVNRAAGRRALARLAREVKRVAFGVGRNAAIAPNEPAREAGRRGSSPSYSAVRDGPGAQGSARPTSDEPRAQARPSNAPEDPPLSLSPRREPGAEPPAPSAPSAPVEEPAPPRAPPAVDPADLPTVELRKEQLSEALLTRLNARAAVDKTPAPGPSSDVDQLLASFGVSSSDEKNTSRDLRALIGLEPTPPPPEDVASRRDSDLDALLRSDPAPAMGDRPAPPRSVLASPPTAISPALANEPIAREAASGKHGAQPPRGVEVPPTLASPSVPTPTPVPKGAPEPEVEKARARSSPTGPSMRRMGEIGEFRQPRAPRTDRVLTFAALVILLGGAATIYVMKPSFLVGHPTPHSTASAPPAPTGPSPSALAAKCREAIVVTDAPNNAEVLLRVGQAPVDVDKMPMGARLEFVATAEGFAPKRAVVPAEATWEPGADGKPRFELPVQLDKSRARPGAIDSWPPAEPGSEVGGKGSPGTVRVVTLPRGAEVWLLAGLGPEARIDQLPCTSSDVDVLVAGPTTLRKRLHVAPGDFLPVDGGVERLATIKAK